jgi:protein-disulfide isomerase
VLIVLGAGWVAIPDYWRVEVSDGPDGLRVGTTWEGHAWIGADDAKVEIVEYSDYQCPHCRRAHAEMRDLVRQRPGTVRLVHRHYPLDQACNPAISRPFHEYACLYARLAHCAGEQGRFWEANDYLFAHGQEPDPISREDLAAFIGIDLEELRQCSNGAAVQRVVVADMAAGRGIGLRGTPTFVLDGKAYRGGIPPEVLEAALGVSPDPE